MKSVEKAKEEVETFVEATNALSNTPERLATVYDAWSNTYDMNMSQLFDGPRQVAEAAAEVVEESARATVRVLDVAAGTGMVGRHLHQRGFRLLDAVEPSKGMMHQLENTGLYMNKFLEFMGFGHETRVPADLYDLVVVSGAFGETHIPVEGIDDIIRAVKPGGKVVITMDLNYPGTVGIYRERLESLMARREAEGYWIKVSTKVTSQYFLMKTEGITRVYSVLKPSH